MVKKGSFQQVHFLLKLCELFRALMQPRSQHGDFCAGDRTDDMQQLLLKFGDLFLPVIRKAVGKHIKAAVFSLPLNGFREEGSFHFVDHIFRGKQHLLRIPGSKIRIAGDLLQMNIQMHQAESVKGMQRITQRGSLSAPASSRLTHQQRQIDGQRFLRMIHQIILHPMIALHLLTFQMKLPGFFDSRRQFFGFQPAFEQVIAGVEVQSVLKQFEVLIVGQHDKNDVRCAFRKNLQKLYPRIDRHFNIADDNIRSKRPNAVQRRLPVVCRAHHLAVKAFPVQHIFDAGQCQLLVIREKDPCHWFSPFPYFSNGMRITARVPLPLSLS